LVFTLNRMSLEVEGIEGTGWTCDTRPGAQLQGSATRISCSYSYTGATPSVLRIDTVDRAPKPRTATLPYWAQLTSGGDRQSCSSAAPCA